MSLSTLSIDWHEKAENNRVEKPSEPYRPQHALEFQAAQFHDFRCARLGVASVRSPRRDTDNGDQRHAWDCAPYIRWHNIYKKDWLNSREYSLCAMSRLILPQSVKLIMQNTGPTTCGLCSGRLPVEACRDI